MISIIYREIIYVSYSNKSINFAGIPDRYIDKFPLCTNQYFD